MAHTSLVSGWPVRGSVLVELLIAVALLVLVVGTLTSSFITQRRAIVVQNQVATMAQQGQAALELLTREIRAAGTNPTGAVFTPVTYSPTQLEMRADLNGNGATDDPNEHVIYVYDAATERMTRDTGNGAEPVVDNVQAFTFTYRDKVGNLTTISSAIRQIQITITVRTAAADPTHTANNGYRTLTLTSAISLRN